MASGGMPRCLLWVGELVDTGRFCADPMATHTLYLRLAGLDAVPGKRTRRSTAVKIVLPFLGSSVLILMCISLAWLKSKGAFSLHSLPSRNIQVCLICCTPFHESFINPMKMQNHAGNAVVAINQ
ncbi:hypothetical protein ZWY2020_008656 [Hordeum vulgare]|nr:hypothetical protein ZWY2020_008656 [Hordeum vulgare]